MKVIHRLNLRATCAQREKLDQLGVTGMTGLSLPGGGDPLVSFDIEEGHPSWPVIKVLIEQWDMGDVPRTTFTTDEIDAAKWLSIRAWLHGYPQPNTNDGYLKLTFDLTNWCTECGLGLKQKAPFRMKGEPRWGRNSMMQMHWVYDCLFAKPEAWSAVFAPQGIGFLPVHNARGADLRTVVQIVIDRGVGLCTDRLPYSMCVKCNRVKYRLDPRDAEPPLAERPTGQIMTSREYFGDGGLATRIVIVGQDIVQALRAANVRGAEYSPLRSDSAGESSGS